MAATIALSTPLGSAYREVLTPLVDSWLQIASASSASTSTAKATAPLALPDFDTLQEATKTRFDAFLAEHTSSLPVEAGLKEALGMDLKRYLDERIEAEFERSSAEQLLAITCACCDVAILSAQADLVDFNVPFMLIEETADMLPVSVCASLWDYAEARRNLLTTGFTPGRGTALVVLRTSNELLRRATKSDTADASFGGRILGFVSEVFPLDERAGRNQLGNFNTSNVTKIEPAPAAKDKQSTNSNEEAGREAGSEEPQDGKDAHQDAKQDESDDGLLPPNFYEDFWALQRFFSNPRSLADPYTPPPKPNKNAAEESDSTSQPPTIQPPTEPNSLKYFYKLTEKVLDVFSKIQAKETEQAFAPRSAKDSDLAMPMLQSETAHVDVQAEAKPAFDFLKTVPALCQAKRVKRKREQDDVSDSKRFKADSTGMDVDGASKYGAAHASLGEADESFFPKFLTGRQLLRYELQDPSFRFHILLQYFVLFQYILSWYGGDERWGKDKCKNAALQRPFVLSNDDNQMLRRQFWPSVSTMARALRPRLSVDPIGATFVTESSLRAGEVPSLLATSTVTRETFQGPDFLRTANQILRREQYWVSWKMNGCEPPIERSWAPKDSRPGAPAASSAKEEEEAQLEALREASTKLSSVLRRTPGPPGGWDHPLGTAALSRLWERGFPPPVEGTRMRENEDGIEQLCKTDGLEALEGFLRDIPTSDELAMQVSSAEERVVERKGEIKQTLLEKKAAERAERAEAEKRKAAEEEAERRKKEEGEADEEEEGEGQKKEATAEAEVEANGDVEMKDLKDADAATSASDVPDQSNGDKESATETLMSASEAPHTQAEAKRTPQPTVADEEVQVVARTDEDYTYLDEGRLNASWKYLRLARTSTVSHWKDLDPSSVATVIDRMKMAKKKPAASVPVNGVVASASTLTGAVAADEGQTTPGGSGLLSKDDQKGAADDAGEVQEDVEMKVLVEPAEPATKETVAISDGAVVALTSEENATVKTAVPGDEDGKDD
ncbi:hypothetical protein OC842_001654 [Tilletia horrida]|uniref:Uncharacterized protein n=1 Tax=Tilletia horrida TaxID=155126 RepID=A0AAN6JN70_9BASI|nr:hypothetical protein OC842_001654 [Tilletia horrida]